MSHLLKSETLKHCLFTYARISLNLPWCSVRRTSQSIPALPLKARSQTSAGVFQSNGTTLKMPAGRPGQVQQGMLNSYWGAFHLSLLTLSLSLASLTSTCVTKSDLTEVMKERGKWRVKKKTKKKTCRDSSVSLRYGVETDVTKREPLSSAFGPSDRKIVMKWSL